MKLFVCLLASAITFVTVNLAPTNTGSEIKDFEQFNASLWDLFFPQPYNVYRYNCIVTSAWCQCKVRDDIKRYTDKEPCKLSSVKDDDGVVETIYAMYEGGRVFTEIISDAIAQGPTKYNYNERYREIKAIFDYLPENCMPVMNGCSCIDPKNGYSTLNATECSKH